MCPMCLHADNEDSERTVFAERTGHFVGFVVRRPINQNYKHLGETKMRDNHYKH